MHLTKKQTQMMRKAIVKIQIDGMKSRIVSVAEEIKVSLNLPTIYQ